MLRESRNNKQLNTNPNIQLLKTMQHFRMSITMSHILLQPNQQPVQNLFMKRIFGILLLTLFGLNSYAIKTVSGLNSGPSVEIASAVENNYLNIEVDDEFSGASFTVSVFSSLGKIVSESQLGLGLNKIDVSNLDEGEYIAVVRKNGEYTNKRKFYVN